ncbi:MAG: hypothetical protein K8Q99_02385 [Acholeplasmataceae bacterium]|nr:hypothetical protein [Acholeplasmataceae bacterium]
MRFDTWTKEEKQLLDFEYKQLFAEQVHMLKKLYRFQSDADLCEDILDNISNVLFNLFDEKHFEFAESLIERMFLSMVSYDITIYKQKNFSDFHVDIYFYDQFQIYRYKNILVKTRDDLKKMIQMMLFIGRKYDQLSLLSGDLSGLTSQQLILGFDVSFVKNHLNFYFEREHIN